MRSATTAALAVLFGLSGCMSATTSHQEHAFPEHKRWSIGWGMEAGRNYRDVWESSDESPVIPAEPLDFNFAPNPNFKLGLGMIGTGLGLNGKAVLGQQGNWAGAIAGTFGFVSGDDTDPWDNVPTWKAFGWFLQTSAILSLGTPRPPSPGRKDIMSALSVGPKLVLCDLSYENLNTDYTWDGLVVDYGAFVGLSLERWFFRITGELSVLRVDRPARHTRAVRPFGGVQLHFSW